MFCLSDPEAYALYGFVVANVEAEWIDNRT